MAVWKFMPWEPRSSSLNWRGACGRARASRMCTALKSTKPACNNTILFTSRPDDRSQSSQETDPRSARLPQARHPVLRHHHSAPGRAGVPRGHRRSQGALSGHGRGYGDRHRSAWVHLRARLGLRTGRRFRAGAQAEETAFRPRGRQLPARVWYRQPGDPQGRYRKRPPCLDCGRSAGHGRHGGGGDETGRGSGRQDRGPGVRRRADFPQRARQTRRPRRILHAAVRQMTSGARTARLLAFAKINLDLRVLYRRPDNYHELRTIFQTISLADRITIAFTPSRKTAIRVNSKIEIPDNLIARAAEACLDAMR